MEEQYCFMCGEPTAALASRAVPICAECRSKRTGTEGATSEWMVHRPGGRSRARGPMTKEAVLLGMARDRISVDDLVARVGSQPVVLCDHPDFRGCFIPGSADEVRISELRSENRADIVRSRRRRMAGRVGAVLSLGLAGFTIYVGLTTRTFVLSGERLDLLMSGWDRVVGAVSGEAEVEAEVVPLPHQEWVQDLASSASPTDKHWSVLFQEARADIWRGDVASVDRARTSLHQVLVSNPDDPNVLAALSEAIVAQGGRDQDWLASATRASARSEFAGPGSVVSARAMAGLALAEGNLSLVARLTEACADEDAACSMIRAEASQELGPLLALVDTYPHSARATMALARTAKAQKSWRVLEDVAGRAARDWAGNAQAWALLGEARAATGRWKQAKEAADKAVSLEDWRLDSRHLSAAVELWTGDASVAKDAYAELIGRPDFGEYGSRTQARIQAGVSALQAGDFAQALVWAEAAHSEAETSAGAMVLRAAALVRLDKEVEAQGVLRDIDHALLSGTAAAPVHYWSGVLFLDMGHQRLARNELEAAAAADPHWSAPQLELAWARLDSGDAHGASEAIRELAWFHPGLKRQHDLRNRVDLGPPQSRSWRGRLSKAMAADVRLSLKLPGTLAVLDWAEGRTGNLAALQAAIAGGDADLDLQAALAQSLSRAERWGDATEACDRVLGSRSRSGLFHALRGHAAFRLDQRPESAASFDRALKYSGDHPTILWWAFEARWAWGDVKGSQAIIDTLKRLKIDESRVARVALARTVQEE